MRRTLVLLLGAVLLAPTALAQTSTGADIEGLARDTTGAVLPGVTVVATNVATGVKRDTVTVSSGRFRLAALPPGEYTLTASLTGFATLERSGLVLRVGQVATLELTMKVATLAETVTVSEAAPVVETARTQLGVVVNSEDIENLPINGRNYLDFAVTVPGVTSPQNTGQGSGLSINGQRQRSNNISVDGADSNGQLNGNARLTVSQEAVQEFQVVTNQFAPEFGRAGGGLVNVVSKSGTNAFSGSAFLYLRDESLDARNAFVPADEPKPQFERKNFGATLGGPIVRDKTFFFAAFEQIARDESDVVTISDANVAAVNAVLAARPIPNGGVQQIDNGTFPVTDDTFYVSLKIDHALNSGNNLSFRYNYGKRDEENGGGVGIGGLTDVSGGGGQRTRDHSFVASWTSTLRPNLLSETRFQYAPRELTQYANDETGPRVSISGVATFGRNVNFPVKLDETRWQLTQTFSWQKGTHFLKAGFDWSYENALTSFPVSFAGSFSFGSLATFTTGRPTTFTQGFGNPEIRLKDTLLTAFVQDSFRPNEKLTFVYGLRYDYDMQPQDIPRDRSNPIEAPLQDGINRDGDNLQPRVSVAFDPKGDGRTVLRAGYGIFYDKIFLLVARNALLARQSISLTGTAAAAQWAQGAFPESDTLPPGISLAAQPNINIADPEIEIPKNHQVTVGVERQLGTDWSVGANYVLVMGRQLLISDNINLAPPTVLTAQNAASLGVANPSPQQLGRNYYTRSRLDPAFNNVQQVSSGGRSRYDGLQLNVYKRMSHGFQLRANYMLSTSKDDGSDFVQAQQPNDPYDREGEYSYSEEHRRHRLTFTGVWQLPYKKETGDGSAMKAIFGDWTLATLVDYRSATAENVSVGSDVNGDGNSSTDRPFIDGQTAERNGYSGPDYFRVDLRLSKKIPIGRRASLTLLADAFNVLNRVNYGGVNLTWGTALEARSTFGEYTSAYDPRQIQLGVRLQF
jgi:hypothetical protein